jgi:hypothetical protein
MPHRSTALPPHGFAGRWHLTPGQRRRRYLTAAGTLAVAALAALAGSAALTAARTARGDQ